MLEQLANLGVNTTYMAGHSDEVLRDLLFGIKAAKEFKESEQQENVERKKTVKKAFVLGATTVFVSLLIAYGLQGLPGTVKLFFG